MDTLKITDIQNALDKLKEKSEQDNTYKIIFHPSIITYDRSIVRTWKQYRIRDKHNRLVYHARKMFWYDTNEIHYDWLHY